MAPAGTGYQVISEEEEEVSIRVMDETPHRRRRVIVGTLGVAVCALAATAAIVGGAGRAPVAASVVSEAAESVSGDRGTGTASGEELDDGFRADDTAKPIVKATSNDYAQNLAACNSWDDDDKWSSTCGYNDYHAWCNHSETVGSGSGFYKYCAAACAGSAGEAYAMVCAWEAIAQLPSVCAETFNSTTPEGLSRDMPNNFDHTTLDLWDCDEHAFCNSCSTGNKYCSAVAHHYGNVGVPYNLTEGILFTYVHTPNGETKIGANAAMRVLNDDLHYWCDKATISAIESGDFFRDYR